jgi:hypothetical protein
MAMFKALRSAFPKHTWQIEQFYNWNIQTERKNDPENNMAT